MITPLDIENKRFSKKKLNGYDPDEVDDFLDELTRDYEILYKKSKESDKEIEDLKVKEPLYIERLNEKIPEKRLKTDGDKVIKPDDIFMTAQKK